MYICMHFTHMHTFTHAHKHMERGRKIGTVRRELDKMKEKDKESNWSMRYVEEKGIRKVIL